MHAFLHSTSLNLSILTKISGKKELTVPRSVKKQDQAWLCNVKLCWLPLTTGLLEGLGRMVKASYSPRVRLKFKSELPMLPKTESWQETKTSSKRSPYSTKNGVIVTLGGVAVSECMWMVQQCARSISVNFRSDLPPMHGLNVMWGTSLRLTPDTGPHFLPKATAATAWQTSLFGSCNSTRFGQALNGSPPGSRKPCNPAASQALGRPGGHFWAQPGVPDSHLLSTRMSRA